ncbi:MAG: thioredoxin-disulfide reductase [Deltaproteobacteria bacterium]|nr:thioredoxin-disulfide reductase [Deltaproteobacteria bacterium]
MSDTTATDEGQEQVLQDVIILGGGPAGFAAGIYAGRGRLKTLVLDGMGGGGQLNTIDTIENFPGQLEAITGPDLVDKMRQQMEKFGTEITFDQAEKVTVDDDAQAITVEGAYGKYRGRTLLLASGARHRHLNVPGEEKLQGRGVSYCATCDGAFFKGQRVAVVGGGDTAVKEAVYLSRVVDHVTVIHRRDQLRAEKVIQEKALASENIDFLWDSVVESIEGEDAVTGLKIRNVKTEEKSELTVTGVFVFVGILPNTDIVKGLVNLDPSAFVVVDADMRTSHPRIFAAGDVRSGSVRQIASAVGDGTTAILNIQEHLDSETPPREQS